MKKRRERILSIVLLFILIIPGIGAIRSFSIKKLEADLPNLSGEKRIEVLSILTDFYSSMDLNKAIKLGNEALKLIVKFPDNRQKSSILLSLGWAYRMSGDYKKSLEFAHNVFDLSRSDGNKKMMARSLNLIGTNMISNGDYAGALDDFQSALNIFEKSGEKREIASTLNNIGIIYDITGDYEQALNYYLKSLKIKEEIGELRWISSTLNNIGVIYNVINFPEKALYYFKRALKINRKINKKESIAIALTNIGNIHNKRKEYSKAIRYYSDSLAIDRDMKNIRGIATSLNNIGLSLKGMGKFDSAMKYFKKSLKIRKGLGDKRLISRTLCNIASIDILIGKYGEAIKGLKSALKIAKNINLKNEKSLIYESLYKVYEKKGFFNKAFYYLKKFQTENKEIAKEQSREKVIEIEKRYQMEKKKKEIELLKKDRTIQKLTIRRQKLIQRLIFIGALILFLIVLFLFYLYRSKKRLNEELKMVNIKLDKFSRTDHLTGLSNRRDMYEKLEYELNRVRRGKVPFSIVLCDIDGFKSFNDRYGHDCGDFILRKLAELMRLKLRKQDTISRWGGEEFLILVPETEIEGAKILSEKIRKSVESEIFIFNGKELSLTLTLGVCMFESGMELSECLKRADEALYRGKKSGKNRVEI